MTVIPELPGIARIPAGCLGPHDAVIEIPGVRNQPDRGAPVGAAYPLPPESVTEYRKNPPRWRQGHHPQIGGTDTPAVGDPDTRDIAYLPGEFDGRSRIYRAANSHSGPRCEIHAAGLRRDGAVLLRDPGARRRGHGVRLTPFDDKLHDRGQDLVGIASQTIGEGVPPADQIVGHHVRHAPRRRLSR